MKDTTRGSETSTELDARTGAVFTVMGAGAEGLAQVALHNANSELALTVTHVLGSMGAATGAILMGTGITILAETVVPKNKPTPPRTAEAQVGYLGLATVGLGAGFAGEKMLEGALQAKIEGHPLVEQTYYHTGGLALLMTVGAISQAVGKALNKR